MTSDPVIDERFLAAASRLRLRAPNVAPLLKHAETPTPRPGSGLDYRDRRPYVCGDDPRRIDWPLYRRSGKLFVRLYDEHRQLGLHILVDCSGSMGFESPPRLNAAKQVAVALAAAGVEELNRVTVQSFADGRLLTPATVAESRLRLAGLASQVVAWKAQETSHSNLADVFEAIRREHRPRCLLVVISDFFDPAGVDDWAPALKRTGHLPALIQLTRHTDRQPSLSGAMEIEDCETSHLQRVVITSRTEAAYLDAYNRFDQALEQAASSAAGRRLSIDADLPVIEQLGALGPSGALLLGTAVPGVR